MDDVFLSLIDQLIFSDILKIQFTQNWTVAVNLDVDTNFTFTFLIVAFNTNCYHFLTRTASFWICQQILLSNSKFYHYLSTLHSLSKMERDHSQAMNEHKTIVKQLNKKTDAGIEGMKQQHSAAIAKVY